MREKLIGRRVRKGISVNTLADKLDISESTIRKVETGLRRPSVVLAKRWADELKIPSSKIIKYFFDLKADNM